VAVVMVDDDSGSVIGPSLGGMWWEGAWCTVA